ncbi:DUF5955 family protein [Thermomonospora amylolytica]|uniref:DUF5955 family protein n=1 Tax=Thermomonospora amylolytica TaxID=1411117 RepID=UPI000E6CF651|nr:DUF5955 family protein [Thermomonospora amylolytica]
MAGEDHRVQIGGNANISGSQIASGRNVHQTQHVEQGGDVSAVEQAIARIAELLERHRAEIDEPHRARRDLEDIQEEVAEAEPDRERVAHALQRLGTRVAGIAVLAQAVADLAALLPGV